MTKLTKKDFKEMGRFIKDFPKKIEVKITSDENGVFTAIITTLPGCVTEADTPSELVAMVNDCVRAYFEIPEKYYPFMPEYRAPARALESFYGIELKQKGKDVKMNLIEVPVYENVPG